MVDVARSRRLSNRALGCVLMGLIGALVIVGLATSLGNEGKPVKTHEAGQMPAGFVSAAMFQSEGKTWPLSVPVAVVGCEKQALLWVEIDGTRYGLNGTAKDFGYPDLGSFGYSIALT